MAKETITHPNGKIERVEASKADIEWAWNELREYAYDSAMDGEWEDNPNLRSALLILAVRLERKLGDE